MVLNVIEKIGEEGRLTWLKGIAQSLTRPEIDRLRTP
jgi:hypothetical protein